MDSVWSVVLQAVERIAAPFLSLGSSFSLTSIACALGIAVAFIAWRLRRRRRPVRAKVIVRALFPRRIACASSGIDFSYLIFNTFVFGVIFGFALLSFRTISSGTFEALIGFANRMSEILGSELPGQVMKAGPRSTRHARGGNGRSHEELPSRCAS